MATARTGAATMATSDRQSRAEFLQAAEAKRRQVMDDLAKPGATPTSVAKAHGISKQRVHQIRKQQAGIRYR